MLCGNTWDSIYNSFCFADGIVFFSGPYSSVRKFNRRINGIINKQTTPSATSFPPTNNTQNPINSTYPLITALKPLSLLNPIQKCRRLKNFAKHAFVRDFLFSKFVCVCADVCGTMTWTRGVENGISDVKHGRIKPNRPVVMLSLRNEMHIGR